MDLDEQELKATRKLHRLDKYDDTDYLINREESIEYKISDTNDDSIKEDIMSEEAFNELIDNFEIVNTLTEYGRKAIKQNVKNLQKRIKELEEENGILEFQNKQVENYVKELKKYNKTVSDRIVEYKKNSISKQKVKDLIENETINISGFECIAVEDLEELLEESK